MDQAFRHGAFLDGDALQGLRHVVDPDRQGQATARFPVAQVARLVVADPGDADQLGLVAGEPRVDGVVGRARLAGQVRALQCHGLVRRAEAHHVVEHAVHHEGIALVDDSVGFLARQVRLGLRQDRAVAVGHLGDQVRVDLVAAVGEHGVGARHLQRRHVAGAEGQGQVGRILVRVKAEARGVFLAVFGADLVQDADGNHVLRFHQALAHGHRTVVLAVVVLRFPRLATRLARIERDGRVVDDGGWRQAPFQRSGIDEGLEGRTGLAPRLRDVVELVAVVIEAADHGADGAVGGAGRDEGRLYFRHLRQDPGVAFQHDADDGAALDAAVRRRFFR